MRPGFWTLASDVAKWLCQNRVMRSRSGWRVKIIRYSQIDWIRTRSADGPSWVVIASSVDSSSAAGVPSAPRGSPCQQPIDTRGRPLAQVTFQDPPAGGKARAAVQVGDALALSQGRAVGRFKRLPGPIRVGQGQGRSGRCLSSVDCLSAQRASSNFN